MTQERTPLKVNSKFDGKRSNNSAAVGLNFQAVFYVFMPVANIESSSVTGSSLKRQNTANVCSLVQIFKPYSTLEATVLKVIRNFLYQPVDNDNLVILNIIVSLITCKSIVLVNFYKQKLNNSKNSGKTDRNILTFSIFRLPRAILVSLPTAQTPT